MRKKIATAALAGMVVVIMGGCSAKGPQFSGFKKPAYGQANVYVYRTSYLGAALTPDIHKTNLTDYRDEVIGSLKPNGYIMTTLSPGMYKFWARTEAENEVKLRVNPNKIYCIEHYISIGFLVGHPQFKVVDMEKCEREIKKTNLSLSASE
ncbi:hypothetical protein [Hydrogenimonas sp.]